MFVVENEKSCWTGLVAAVYKISYEPHLDPDEPFRLWFSYENAPYGGDVVSVSYEDVFWPLAVSDAISQKAGERVLLIQDAEDSFDFASKWFEMMAQAFKDSEVENDGGAE